MKKDKIQKIKKDKSPKNSKNSKIITFDVANKKDCAMIGFFMISGILITGDKNEK